MEQTSQSPASQPAAAPASLDMRFLKRTVLASVITIMFVSLFAAVYYDMQWSLRYLSFAVWGLAFFGMTGGIIQGLFTERKAQAMACMAGKVALLGGLYVLHFALWPIHDADGTVPTANLMAFVAGVGTLFAVLMLRIFGFLLEIQRTGRRLSILDLLPPVGPATGPSVHAKIER